MARALKASHGCGVLLLLLLLINGLFSCRKPEDPDSNHQPAPFNLTIPPYFPTKLNIPADNPMTEEGVMLGRLLFYDGRLSGRLHPDSLMSCGTCHLQARSFECGIDHPRFHHGRPVGLGGMATPHSMLPLINLVWVPDGFLWNGLVHSEGPSPSMRQLEDLAWMVIHDPYEIAGDTLRTVALLQSIPGYPPLFRDAFGSETITAKNIGRAIAQFVRTLITSGSRFDRFMKGDLQLTPSERNGYVLFMTEQGGDCFHCHGGEGNPLFTTNLFYNNGKDSVFNEPGDRYSITGKEADIGAYRAPTLRNLIFTAPYMHDGRFRSIDEVLNFYNSGLKWSPYIHPLMHHIAKGGVRLNPTQLADLKAFLLTLTDSSFVTNPAFSAPDSFPDFE